IFPSVKDRVGNKKQPNLAIILHRSNEQVRETNISIRPYLFPDVNPELIESTPFLKGEILQIESSQFQEDDDFENQVFAGETVVVLNADLLDANKYIDKLYGKFWKLTVKPTFRLDETHLAIFKLNLGLFNRNNKEILVWDGFLNSTNSNEDTFKHYKNDLRQASNIGLVTDDDRKRQVNKAYAVKYGYSKTNYSAQGGEWNNVILQVSDADWDSKYTNARFLYTAVSRATNNIFFVNS
ncbi:MAG: ATP-binding domain-containing protein, partial [Saprospiraceae bacterium]|nr:ATP-binding domain-containing protein [Saprospiraceae bacterium]